MVRQPIDQAGGKREGKGCPSYQVQNSIKCFIFKKAYPQLAVGAIPFYTQFCYNSKIKSSHSVNRTAKSTEV